MILIQFLICGHTARAVCGLKFDPLFHTPDFCGHTARAVCGLKYTMLDKA